MAAKTSQPTVKIVRFDWATKSLLRDKANFEILEGFLQSLLDEKLEIVEILESEGNAESEQAKFNRVDLLAKDSRGRRVLVEIQNERESDYIERMLFGTSKLVVESIGIGQAYRDIPKVISIHILYFNLGQGTDYVYSGTTELRGVHTDEPLLVSERFTKPDGTHLYKPKDVWPEYHVINVERFKKMDEEDLEMLDQWVYLFKQSEVRGDFDAPGMASAREKLAYLKMGEDEKQRYQRFVENVRRELDIMSTAHQEGLEEGLEKGEQIGLEKGERAILLKLRESGKTDAEISELTGIPKKEVVRLLADGKA